MLSQALKTNTTLTKLGLRGKTNRKEHSQTNILTHSIPFNRTESTGNDIGIIGAIELSETLMLNKTLTELDLDG